MGLRLANMYTNQEFQVLGGGCYYGLRQRVEDWRSGVGGAVTVHLAFSAPSSAALLSPGLRIRSQGRIQVAGLRMKVFKQVYK